jgi:hypothetical protein
MIPVVRNEHSWKSSVQEAKEKCIGIYCNDYHIEEILKNNKYARIYFNQGYYEFIPN